MRLETKWVKRVQRVRGEQILAIRASGKISFERGGGGDMVSGSVSDPHPFFCGSGSYLKTKCGSGFVPRQNRIGICKGTCIKI